jgi:hypothetical protein
MADSRWHMAKERELIGDGGEKRPSFVKRTRKQGNTIVCEGREGRDERRTGRQASSGPRDVGSQDPSFMGGTEWWTYLSS